MWRYRSPSRMAFFTSSALAVMLKWRKGDAAMPSYCVNKNAQSNGDHEVHDTTANKPCLPATWNRQDLGYHGTCSEAGRAARLYFTQVDGCAICTPACHSS